MVLKSKVYMGCDGRAETMVNEHNGLLTEFARVPAIGGLAINTRVRKVNQERDDYMDNGQEGRVVGGRAMPLDLPVHPKFGEILFLYFVEWDAMPKRALATVAPKLEKI